MRRWIVAAVCLVVLGVGQPARAAGVRYLDEMFGSVVRTSGIVYGHAVAADGTPQDLLLDVYEPDGGTDARRAVYIWAHGGSFRTGGRASHGPIEAYTRAGWVTMSIDYRLRPDMQQGWMGILTGGDPAGDTEIRLAAARDAQHDMQAAVRWARANADAWRLDPDRIAVGGFSAGAEMALMLAFNASDPGGSGNPGHDSRVGAAVAHGGAYGPGTHGTIDPGEAPIAVLHGTHDTTVPIAASLLPCAATVAVLNTCEPYVYPGEDHDVLGADDALSFLYRTVIGSTGA